MTARGSRPQRTLWVFGDAGVQSLATPLMSFEQRNGIERQGLTTTASVSMPDPSVHHGWCAEDAAASRYGEQRSRPGPITSGCAESENVTTAGRGRVAGR